MDVLALVPPSVNRVYGTHAARLATSELTWVLNALTPGALESVEGVTEGGIDYLRLRFHDDALEEPATALAVRRALAHSPHVFAAFEEAGRMPVLDALADAGEGGVVGAGENGHGNGAGTNAREGGEPMHMVDELPTLPLLQPLPLPIVDRYDSRLLTTLKYQGKTNEQFTALMLHLAIAAAGPTAVRSLTEGTLRVLDPVAGRGTALNQALMWGAHAIGVDLDKKDAEIYRGFVTGWMRDSRLKHTATSTRLASHGTVLGQHFHAELAPCREDFKRGHRQHLDLYTADTTALTSFLKPRSADVLVADLPYGVQHGATGKRGLERSALGLVEAATPGWAKVIVPGGSMVLAINRHTAPWADVAHLLEGAGLEVVNEEGQFRHRVDASIDRDLVVARTRSVRR